MRQIVVHAGVHKTGTSSIQNSLASELVDPHYQYINFGQPNSSGILNRAYFSLNKAKMEARIGRISEEHSNSVRRNAISKIERILSGITKDTGILSAESISHFSQNEIQNLKNDIEKHCDNIFAYLYIRRPYEYFESAFQQALQEQLVDITRVKKFRFQDRIQKFDLVFGKMNVNLRVFDRKNFVNSCVVQDFCQWVGFQYPSEKVIRANESLSLEATKLLYIYRKANPRRQQHDKKIISRLRYLRGPKFQFQSKMLTDLCWVDQEQLHWMEERVGQRLQEEQNVEIGCASAEDLVTLGKDALEWLSAEADIGFTRLGNGDQDLIARAVKKLGE